MKGVLTCLLFSVLLIGINCSSNNTEPNNVVGIRRSEINDNNFPGPWRQVLRKGVKTMSGIKNQIENVKSLKNSFIPFATTTEKTSFVHTPNPLSSKGIAESINDDQYIPMCRPGTFCVNDRQRPSPFEIDNQFTRPPFEKDNRQHFSNDEERVPTTTTTTQFPIPAIDEQIPIRPNINLFTGHVPRPPQLLFPFNRFAYNPHIMNRGPIMALPFFTQLQMMPPQMPPPFFYPYFRHQPLMMAPSTTWQQLQILNSKGDQIKDDKIKDDIINQEKN